MKRKDPHLKLCRGCGKKYAQSGAHSLLCCNGCFLKASHNVSLSRVKTGKGQYLLTCRACKLSFESKNITTQCCSGACRIEYRSIAAEEYRLRRLASPAQYKKNPNDPKGRFLILSRDSFTCIYCGLSSIEDLTKLHVDHIYPYVCGGLGIAGNLITSCEECNLSKWAHLLPEEARARVQAIAFERNTASGILNEQKIKGVR